MVVSSCRLGDPCRLALLCWWGLRSLSALPRRPQWDCTAWPCLRLRRCRSSVKNTCLVNWLLEEAGGRGLTHVNISRADRAGLGRRRRAEGMTLLIVCLANPHFLRGILVFCSFKPAPGVVDTRRKSFNEREECVGSRKHKMKSECPRQKETRHKLCIAIGSRGRLPKTHCPTTSCGCRLDRRRQNSMFLHGVRRRF